jgi:hypothetical protein
MVAHTAKVRKTGILVIVTSLSGTTSASTLNRVCTEFLIILCGCQSTFSVIIITEFSKIFKFSEPKIFKEVLREDNPQNSQIKMITSAWYFWTLCSKFIVRIQKVAAPSQIEIMT